MTDCYRILGVDSGASLPEIRAAYLAAMKRAHPDAAAARGEHVGASASEITFAYWQLRDPARRATHDRLLVEETGRPLPRRPTVRREVVARRAPAAPQPRPPSRRPRRRGNRLRPVRAAAGVAAFSVAAIAFLMAFTYFQPQRESGSDAAGTAGVRPGAEHASAKAKPPHRRPDRALLEAAAGEFRTVLRMSGHPGTGLYGRQCLAELAAQPTLSMLDYCLAFDSAGAAWEEQRDAAADERRYFAVEQRVARYRDLAEGLGRGPVRDAMLAEISYLVEPAG